MGILLYNSLTGKKEPLQTLEPGKVRFYACGPTVYHFFHLGNARMFVVFDTIRRYLEYRGYEVRFVQNFTDIDDRIIQRAQELGISPRELAEENIRYYFEDAGKLFIRPATVHPRVTECVDEIIRFIQDLIDRGHAYERNGSVYFDTSSFPEYGKLSHQSPEDMRAGYRIEVQDEKDDPTDFALWKAAKPGEEWWPSPWGPGRPGWHIECSVMNYLYLGEQIDIHAGGRDLIFPHHENEIAQSEAHSGKTFARYWLHNGTLNINGEKMSKSTGNFIMARDLLERRDPRAVRFFLLSAHYRNPLNYTEEALDQAEQALSRIDRLIRDLDHRAEALKAMRGALDRADEVPSTRGRSDVEQIRSAFIQAMDDDFNTADGMAAIFDGVRVVNTRLEEGGVTLGDLRLYRDLFVELLGVLGIPKKEEERLEDEIERLIAERAEARKRRDFARADEIRDQLRHRGIVLEDTPYGTRWSYES
ncbi:cysteine--tRNA ligase [Alicyclobacillus acidocaldarius]|uniref:Cysteine--tRNA ligase n=1 Tax=Alicyclobacillus acidocaldarius subsp. acidocaldarius (strain ATCC 27009 / DSM 446 / BCRC 14685 / JCM 5260 / KCTC 1825 / NBRC 15652 / NCIMB 11725 / NRRL B-14509 / 104-IA) TaxID=521098 RepID=C8WTZ4_ALIAD|nr:cysteine--tRNA ligase [Alicyclobacillus acidocaldarius]ACV59736.1 cysteinyl-tRNA synthetase [Alicyclobacillus acidocaldarius subsp. acidocaldarius DSM 446]